MLAVIVLAGVTAAVAETRGWETVERVPAEAVERMTVQDEVPVAVVGGYVYVVLRRPVTIGLFTILGQPLVQSTLQPGSYRFRISRRGIYLLKTGPTIRRLTV